MKNGKISHTKLINGNYIFWMTDVNEDIIKEARMWLEENDDQYEERNGTDTIGNRFPIYWEILNNDIAIAFKLIFCGDDSC